MKINKIVFFILIGITALAFAAAFLSPNSQSQSKSEKLNAEKDIPIVDIYSPEIDDPVTKEIRQLRGQRYNTGVPLVDEFKPNSDLLDLPSSHAPAEAALPIGQSNLVAIGTVVDSKAFLSNDRTNVYSEFVVRVEKTLRNNSPLELGTRSEITAERVGGKVRFSSGNILRRGVLGKNFPAKHDRYVLFLQWNEAGKDFVILTGYKLKDGRVTPLDGDKSPYSVYRNYAQFEGKSEGELISAIKTAIRDSGQEALMK